MLAAGGARTIATLLYGVQSTDLPTFLSAIVALAAVGSLAAWVPARRASRLPPTSALREE